MKNSTPNVLKLQLHPAAIAKIQAATVTYHKRLMMLRGRVTDRTVAHVMI